MKVSLKEHPLLAQSPQEIEETLRKAREQFDEHGAICCKFIATDGEDVVDEIKQWDDMLEFVTYHVMAISKYGKLCRFDFVTP